MSPVQALEAQATQNPPMELQMGLTGRTLSEVLCFFRNLG